MVAIAPSAVNVRTGKAVARAAPVRKHAVRVVTTAKPVPKEAIVPTVNVRRVRAARAKVHAVKAAPWNRLLRRLRVNPMRHVPSAHPVANAAKAAGTEVSAARAVANEVKVVVKAVARAVVNVARAPKRGRPPLPTKRSPPLRPWPSMPRLDPPPVSRPQN